jgi:hypothetical protein
MQHVGISCQYHTSTKVYTLLPPRNSPYLIGLIVTVDVGLVVKMTVCNTVTEIRITMFRKLLFLLCQIKFLDLNDT